MLPPRTGCSHNKLLKSSGTSATSFTSAALANGPSKLEQRSNCLDAEEEFHHNSALLICDACRGVEDEDVVDGQRMIPRYDGEMTDSMLDAVQRWPYPANPHGCPSQDAVVGSVRGGGGGGGGGSGVCSGELHDKPIFAAHPYDAQLSSISQASE